MSNNERWYGRPSDRGGGDDAKQGVILLLGVLVVLLVLLAWSHFGLSVSSVPSLPAPRVENALPVSTVAPALGPLRYLNCVDASGDFWRASYRQGELTGPGVPDSKASQRICADLARRVAD